MSATPGKNQPDKRDRRRPVQLLVFAAVLGVFVTAVVFMGTREPLIALEFGGVAFIVGLVVLAMLSLAARPTGDEQADLDEQNRGEQNRGEEPRGH
ncbi:hypothetical protein QT381_04795 [Galbitalea sp. SE-J8]|uniref:hypothetical protein n=1 Tax=Galbitalea sp. SE-J8 TaxID=3054952 RepID=UPI00259CB0AC|nr:hypothetical protein [Galbitalea sp. SE-J8]MDM4762322.1 hypothetical protein [Galbitalea sp. SE-J8]